MNTNLLPLLIKTDYQDLTYNRNLLKYQSLNISTYDMQTLYSTGVTNVKELDRDMQANGRTYSICTHRKC